MLLLPKNCEKALLKYAKVNVVAVMSVFDFDFEVPLNTITK